MNAVKISGRTKGKLGVGIFNAITEKTYARVTDTITGNRREVLVEPFSNYNIVVLDQQFNDNSSVSVINTNVTRNGSFQDANTSALVFDIADRGNRFRSSGRAVFSNVINTDGVSTGFRSELDVFRIKGKIRYRVGHEYLNPPRSSTTIILELRCDIGGSISQVFKPKIVSISIGSFLLQNDWHLEGS